MADPAEVAVHSLGDAEVADDRRITLATIAVLVAMAIPLVVTLISVCLLYTSDAADE